MAASLLARPGTKSGPCKNKCTHRDCAATRADAAHVCKFCKKQIGYDTLYYRVEGELQHAACAEACAAARAEAA